ncbi:MAG: hypothetical protein EBS33_03560 [Alphaproteobacteria bacterium]|nr:hypothetical protein [Alphaproteobacteria bacterium]
MDILEEKLDFTTNKIKQLEEDIAMLDTNMQTLHEQIKELQKFIVKLVHNQTELTKRVSAWPYIAVSEK